MRADVRRAIGEYAGEGGRVGEASTLVSGFFGALESFDFALFEAVRFERPVAANGRELLDSAVAALDRCFLVALSRMMMSTCDLFPSPDSASLQQNSMLSITRSA